MAFEAELRLCTCLASWFITPLDLRTPLTFVRALKLIFLSSVVHTGAIQIRLRHPRLALHWRILYFLFATRCSLVWTFSHYADFVADRKPYLLWLVVDSVIGMGGSVLIVYNLDALFLGREEDFNVAGAAEYRQWLETCTPALTKAEIETKVREISGGYTLERPRFFPGTDVLLPFHIAGAVSGKGYGIEANRKKDNLFRAGYEALIDSEELSKQPPEIARWIKRDAIQRACTALFGYFVVGDLAKRLTKHHALVQTPFDDDFYSLYEATERSPLGSGVAMFIATAAFGVQIICTLQMAYLACYLYALVKTSAVKIPIVISLWEPYFFIEPYKATSMTNVWGIHWHAMTRRMVTIVCLRPARQLAARLALPVWFGRATGVLLSFLFAGIFHEAGLEAIAGHVRSVHSRFDKNDEALRAMGYGFGGKGFATIRTFLAYGLIVVLEQFWITGLEATFVRFVWSSKEKSSKVVDGTLRTVTAWLWTMSLMVYFGMPMIDVWCMHGMSSIGLPSMLFSRLF